MEQVSKNPKFLFNSIAGGDSYVGSINVDQSEHHNYFGKIDNINIIIGDVRLGNFIRKSISEWGSDDKDKQFLQGILRESIEVSGAKVDKYQAKIYDRAFAADLTYRRFEDKRKFDSMIESIELISAKINNIGSLDNRKSRRWNVDNGIANKISNLSYNDPNIELLRENPGVNDGVLSVLDSLKYYLSGDLIGLTENTAQLISAFKWTDNKFAKNIILGRIIVNSNLMSDRDTAARYAKKINFDKITNRKVKATLLDYLATISFNNIGPKKFQSFKNMDFNKLKHEWLSIGVDVASAHKDDMIIKDFGLHIFTIQQIRYFDQCQDVKDNSNSFINFRHLRSQMIEDFKRSIHISEGKSHKYSIAQDFFGSLQRPAYHALLCRDYLHLKYILDIYYGRNKDGDVNVLNDVRGKVLKSTGRNRQWMALLDIVSKKRYDAYDAENDFTKLIFDYNLLSARPIIINQAILRTIPYVAEGLNLKADLFIKSSKSIRSSRIKKLDMHRAYSFGIIDSMSSK